MKTLTPLLTFITVACLAQPGASAQNVLTSGDVTVGTNWSMGSPTTPGNTGIINSSNTGANEGLLPTTTTGLYISQTGGTVQEGPGFVLTSTLDNTQYDISGGEIILNSLTLQNGSSLTMSDGEITLGAAPGNPRNFTIGSTGTFTISGGVFDISNGLTASSGAAADKVFNFFGGTTIVSGSMFSGFQPSGTANFSGDASLDVGGTLGANQANFRLLNIGGGTGIISTATLEARNMTIDWTDDASDFAITATTIVSSGAATTWEDLWTTGNLLFEGSNTGNFADTFQVDGSNTLTLVIPEPSVYALLAGSFALGLVIRRRRA